MTRQGTCIEDPWTRNTWWGLTVGVGGSGTGESNRKIHVTTLNEQEEKRKRKQKLCEGLVLLLFKFWYH